MKQYINSKNIIFFCLLLTLVVLIWGRFFTNGTLALIYPYTLSDWLINYSTGFTRRGLAGTFLFWLQNELSVQVDVFFIYFCFATYILLAGYYFYYVFKLRHRISFLAIFVLFFLPASIVFPILDYGALGRKEFLLLIVLILHIQLINFFIRKIRLSTDLYPSQFLPNINKYFYVVFIGYNGFGLAFALTHESILFLSIPINMALSFLFICQFNGLINACLKSFVLYLPTFILTIALLTGQFELHVNHDRAVEMCLPFDQLESINCHKKLLAFKYLGQSPEEAIDDAYRKNIKPTAVFITWIFLITVNLILAVYAGLTCYTARFFGKSNPDFDPQKILSISILILMCLGVSLLASFPLFVITSDWGRWVSIIIVSFLLCCISCENIFTPLIAVYSQSSLKLSKSLHQTYNKLANQCKPNSLCGTVIILFVIYVLSSTTFRHCCIKLHNLVELSLTKGNIDLLIKSFFILLFEGIK